MFLLVLMTWVGSVSASVQVKGLYEVQIAVKTQGRDERSRALQQGLADVVRRLAGSKGLKNLASKRKVMARASRYVEQYRYSKQSTDEAGLFLWARFNKKALLVLLQRYKIPVWVGSRPETLLWLAIEDGGERYILGSDRNNDWSDHVLSHAQRRGVPVLLPLMDLEDRRNTRIGDIWGGFSKSLRTASNRYQPDEVMIGKIFRIGSRWNSRWTLVTTAGEKTWSARGKSASGAIASGLNGLANFMAARYSVRLSGQLSRYRLLINNVNTLQDYADIKRYLGGISLISKLQLDSVEPVSVTYSMDLRGGVTALKQVLGLEQKLLPDESAEPQPSVETGLTATELTATDNTVALPDIMTYRLR